MDSDTFERCKGNLKAMDAAVQSLPLIYRAQLAPIMEPMRALFVDLIASARFQGGNDGQG